MSSINTNITSLIAQNALRSNSQKLDKVMERLATGKRINSGADDPAGLAMAARMRSSSVSSRQGESNANDAISMLQLYSNAGQSIVNLIINMKQLAVRGATDTMGLYDRMALDSSFNSLGQTWIRIAADTQWNSVSVMDTFNNAFIVRLDDSATPTTMTFKSWDPTNMTTNQNVTGATAIMADDENARADWAWGFGRVLPSLTTPPQNLGKSHSHIQSKTASINAVAKLDATMAGVTAELALYGAYINRLEYAASNSRSAATQTDQAYSKIVDADYAKETTELTRLQILTQAATAILAQANKAPQMLLKLLQ